MITYREIRREHSRASFVRLCIMQAPPGTRYVDGPFFTRELADEAAINYARRIKNLGLAGIAGVKAIPVRGAWAVYATVREKL